MVKISVMGAAGRMGRSIIQSCIDAEGVELVSAIERDGSDFIGADAGGLAGRDNVGVKVTSDLTEGLKAADVVIDFTAPESTFAIIEQQPKALVIGTTGFDADGLKRIDEASKSIPIVFAPNMSVGVNLVFKVLEKVTKVIGNDYDMEIVESHHRYKKDAPSGTALGMGKVMAGALEKNLDDIGVFERNGIIGERKPGTIGIQSIRAGDIVGEHTAIFCGNGERIEITHKADSRMIFANGAVRAGKWLGGKNADLYSMYDVLDLGKIFG